MPALDYPFSLISRAEPGCESANTILPQNTKCYFIVSSMRSGSTMFCNMLHHNALFNEHRLEAGEYFHLSVRADQQQYISDHSVHSFFQQSVADRTVLHNNRFQLSGFKLLQDQLHWISTLSAENIDTKYFLSQQIKYVYLRRRNKAQQAISLLRANHENRWHYLGKPDHSTSSTTREYSKQQIANTLAGIDAHENWIEQYFSASCIRPLSMYYEDIIYDPSREINRLASHLGLPTIENPDTQTDYWKTRDHANLQLELKFNQS